MCVRLCLCFGRQVGGRLAAWAASSVCGAGRRRLWAAACCRVGSMRVCGCGVRRLAATRAAWAKIEMRKQKCDVERGIRAASVMDGGGGEV